MKTFQTKITNKYKELQKHLILVFLKLNEVLRFTGEFKLFTPLDFCSAEISLTVSITAILFAILALFVPLNPFNFAF